MASQHFSERWRLTMRIFEISMRLASDCSLELLEGPYLGWAAQKTDSKVNGRELHLSSHFLVGLTCSIGFELLSFVKYDYFQCHLQYLLMT